MPIFKTNRNSGVNHESLKDVVSCYLKKTPKPFNSSSPSQSFSKIYVRATSYSPLIFAPSTCVHIGIDNGGIL